MRFLSNSLCTVALVLAAAVPVAASAEAETPPQACYSGAYRFADGSFVVMSPSEEGALRYRLSDGRSGRLYPDDDKHFHGGPGWASREPRIADAANAIEVVKLVLDDSRFPSACVEASFSPINAVAEINFDPVMSINIGDEIWER